MAENKSTSGGALRSGKERGLGDRNIGNVVLVQSAYVSAAETSAATKFQIDTVPRPTVLWFDIDVEQIFEASANAQLVFTVDGTKSLIDVSAAKNYRHVLPASATHWTNISAANGLTNILVNVSAVGTAPDTGAATIRMFYTRSL